VKIIRKIVLPEERVFSSYAEWQALYMDSNSGFLIPDTEIWSGDKLILKVNSLGCKGEEMAGGPRVLGFFGDSATFGISFSPDSWPRHVAIPGCQVLNAAVEGHELKRVLARYRDIRERVNLSAVVVYSGWHNIIYNESHEDYWRNMLDQFAGDHVLGLCTLGTCLTEECLKKGIESLLCTDSPNEHYANYFEYNRESYNKTYFNLWSNMAPTLANVKKVFYGVRRYNDFLRRYCDDNGYILIDLYSSMRPACYEEIPRDFFDVCHPRPKAYEKIGRFVGTVLREHVEAQSRGKTRTSQRRLGDGESPALAVSGPREDLRKNVYPLW
jgi:hypothetical protein